MRVGAIVWLLVALLTVPALAGTGAQTVRNDTVEPGGQPMSAAQPAPASGPHNPVAVIHTTAGDLRCEIFLDKVPMTSANFIGLATGSKDWTDPATGKLVHGRPLYDGVIFHRVIPGFMIQGGDPLGTGMGGPGYQFADELRPALTFDRPGRLAMANAGPNTNGSQFFITETAQPGLDPPRGAYTIFGQCDNASVELVKKIARMPVGQQDRPLTPVKIVHIEIIKPGKSG